MAEQGLPSGIRRAEIVASLSLVTDLGTGQPLERALRTCVLAVRLGELAGLSQVELRTVYYVALLRFVGCTADAKHLADIFGDERLAQARVATVELLPVPMLLAMARYAGDGYPPSARLRMLGRGLSSGINETREGGVAHCEVSQNIARRLELGDGVVAALAQIYERWDGRGIPGLVKRDGLSRAIRLVHIAQDVEVFSRVGGIDAARNAVQTRAGGAYDPDLVAAFVRQSDRLLRELDQDSIWDKALALEPTPHLALTEPQLDQAMRAIADFTDLRSPFTHGHSSRVAELAFAAASRCLLSPAEARAIRHAGYLHDCGRVAISLQIWDKPGALTGMEWERVRLYPYYTERITARSPGLSPCGRLAALHRERLDGSGYHRGLPAAMLPESARLLAAVDVFLSKTEARVYRPALAEGEAADHLHQQAKQGRLDRGAVDAVIACATGSQRPLRRSHVGNLSDREVEVLRLIAIGWTTRTIAGHLGISPKTADHHIQHIYTKVGVSTRAAATLFAMQHNLLGP